MKLYRNLLLGASALMCAAGFVACEEEATLEGAKSIYIEMTPTEYTVRLGDTIPVGVVVTNESGKNIATTVKWSVDDESVVRLINDSALVAVQGGQGKVTNLRATLPNGRYGIAKVSVVNNLTQGIAVVDTNGIIQSFKNSYNIGHDSVVFTVLPKEALFDYPLSYNIEGEGLELFADQPLYVDYNAGTVAVHYSAGRKYGIGKVNVTLGESSGAYTGSIDIRMDPPICMVSFWGPDYESKYGLGSGRPPVTHNPDFAADSYERMMDVNMTDTCRVAVNVTTADVIDIREAMKCYRWEAIEGSSVLVAGMWEELVDGHGFDAVFVVRSGIVEGETMFRMITPTDTLVATYRVFNYKESYPVDEITCDPMEVNIASGEVKMLTTGVIPAASFGFHKPKVVPDDPEIVMVGEYIGNQIPVTGMKTGDTYLTLTANGKTLRVPVHVSEAVSNILWKGDRLMKLFTGQSTQWNVDVRTPSGAENPYPLSFISSDESIVVGEIPEGINTYGFVKGVGAGKATIRAKVLNVTSDAGQVEVITAPNESNGPVEGAEIGVMTDSDGETRIDITPAKGTSEYKQILIQIPAPRTETVDVVSGSKVVIDGAEAAIVSGSIKFISGNDGELKMSGTIVMDIPGNGQVTWTFNNLTAWDWD